MKGTEHWTRKGDVKLFLWQKSAVGASRGTLLFVHGSSMASQPTFDLEVPGRPHSSVMDWFAERGFDTWCLDNEGYGRSDKSRPVNCDIANGADDLAAASAYIGKPLLLYGISSGALKAALFAERHPERSLKTNVEYYAAPVLLGVGLTPDLFPATFSLARHAGWTAHALEQSAEDRIIRPDVRYVGPAERDLPA